jgi:hypothetical protein
MRERRDGNEAFGNCDQRIATGCEWALRHLAPGRPPNTQHTTQAASESDWGHAPLSLGEFAAPFESPRADRTRARCLATRSPSTVRAAHLPAHQAPHRSSRCRQAASAQSQDPPSGAIEDPDGYRGNRSHDVGSTAFSRCWLRQGSRAARATPRLRIQPAVPRTPRRCSTGRGRRPSRGMRPERPA